ncbi:MAG: YbaN family protein [Firmicutes bacterium]|nr:YbaN family protein [Bacillota bacterium]
MKRVIYTILGLLCLMIGVVGIVMPLVPTTPFVILSSICFARSCKWMNRWLRRTPIFGHFIRNYEDKTGIPIWVKIQTLVFLWVGLATSMILLDRTFLYIKLPIIGLCVTIHILMIKTWRRDGIVI